MIIACEKCTTRFHIDVQKLGAIGRKVRCATCHHIWLQMPDKVEMVIEGQTINPANWQIEENNTFDNDSFEQQGVFDDDDAEIDYRYEAEIGDAVDEIDPALAAEAKLAELLGSKKHLLGNSQDDDIDDHFEGDDISARKRPGKIARQRFSRPRSNLPALIDNGAHRSRLFIGWTLFALVFLIVTVNLYLSRQQISAHYGRAEKIYAALGLLTTERPIAPDPAKALQIHIEQRQAELRDGHLVADFPGKITNQTDNRVLVPLIYGVLCDKDNHQVHSWSFRTNVVALDGLASTNFETSVTDLPETTVKLRMLFEADYKKLHNNGTTCVE